jgi:hypothetical protein
VISVLNALNRKSSNGFTCIYETKFARVNICILAICQRYRILMVSQMTINIHFGIGQTNHGVKQLILFLDNIYESVAYPAWGCGVTLFPTHRAVYNLFWIFTVQNVIFASPFT